MKASGMKRKINAAAVWMGREQGGNPSLLRELASGSVAPFNSCLS